LENCPITIISRLEKWPRASPPSLDDRGGGSVGDHPLERQFDCGFRPDGAMLGTMKGYRMREGTFGDWRKAPPIAAASPSPALSSASESTEQAAPHSAFHHPEG
jgi:hypothetical protein